MVTNQEQIPELKPRHLLRKSIIGLNATVSAQAALRLTAGELNGVDNGPELLIRPLAAMIAQQRHITS